VWSTKDVRCARRAALRSEVPHQRNHARQAGVAKTVALRCEVRVLQARLDNLLRSKTPAGFGVARRDSRTSLCAMMWRVTAVTRISRFASVLYSSADSVPAIAPVDRTAPVPHRRMAS
jgi:hypothetical protein